MYVHLDFFFSVQAFVSLKGYQDPISDAICFKDDFGGVYLDNMSFYVIDHYCVLFCGLYGSEVSHLQNYDNLL